MKFFQHNGDLETFEWTVVFCSTPSDCTMSLNSIFEGGGTNLKEVIINKWMLKSDIQLQVHQDLFSGSGNLTKLLLNAMGTESLPANLLRTNKKLKHFEIKNNRLTALPDLSNCPLLETLLVTGNNISSLDSDIFLTSTNLKVLDLSGNKLHTLPSTIFSATPFLEFLDLSNNELRGMNIEVLLGPIFNVKNVSLANNNIEMKGLPKIWKSNWTEIENVDLSGNLISQNIDLADWNFNLGTKQVHLNLSNNDITNIGNSHNHQGRCTEIKVQTIEISGNPLKCDCFTNYLIQSMQEDVCYDNIRLVSTDIPCVTKLGLSGIGDRTLNHQQDQCTETVGNCSLVYIPRLSLQKITCNASSLVTIPQTRNKTHLVLQNIENLSGIKKTVQGYETLTSLTLSDNQLTQLSVSDLPTNLNGTLALDGNLFHELDSELVAKLETLENVTLSGNPFYCDCRSVDVYNFFRQNQKIIWDFDQVSLECNLYLNKINNIDEFCANPTVILLPIIVTLLCLLVIITVCLYHREKIFIWLYSNPRMRKFFLEDPATEGLPYDVFVSYVHQVSIITIFKMMHEPRITIAIFFHRMPTL